MINLIQNQPAGRVFDGELRGKLIAACQAAVYAYGDRNLWWEYASDCGANDADVVHVVDASQLIDVQFSWAVTNGLLLIAFRGTPPSSLSAWVQNIDPLRRDALGGMVHAGFNNEFLAIERQLAEVIRFYGKNRQVHLVGHSKGGALARMTAYVRGRLRLLPDGVFTFGEPRSLGWSAARWLDDQLAYKPNIRCIHSNDPVPLLPGLTCLNRWRYRHCGERVLLTEKGRIIRDAGLWDVANEWVRGFRMDLIEDHFADEYLLSLHADGTEGTQGTDELRAAA